MASDTPGTPQNAQIPAGGQEIRKPGGSGENAPSSNREAIRSLDRRAFLRQGILAGAGLGAALLGSAGCNMAREQVKAITGPAPAMWIPLPRELSLARAAAHTLNRAAFGPRPGDVAQVARMGVGVWLEEQLADQVSEDPAVAWRVNGLDTQQTEQDAPDLLSSMPDDQMLIETEQASLLRAIYSRHQLREVMADFWTNHFNLYALKNDGRTLIPVDTERVLRPHILGRFHDLLVASAHSPAMLAYLDNNQNRRGVANENYARELLELHTLGVNSGYTQHDIQEVARCFTGWTVQGGFPRGVFQSQPPFIKAYDGFQYDASRHDETAKYIPFLHLTIAPKGGKQDVNQVLEALTSHPATARFLARKLCRRFLGNTPDAVVEKAANAYLKSKSDIRATLRPILLEALQDPTVCKPIFKRPLDFTVSALRALAADTDGGANLQKHLAAMGQPLYQWPMPDGFPEKAAAWTGSLLPRWNMALALTGNTIDGTRVDLNAPLSAAKAHTEEEILNALLEAVYARPHSAPELEATATQVRKHIQEARRNGVPDSTLLAEATGLLLSAPTFQWK